MANQGEAEPKLKFSATTCTMDATSNINKNEFVLLEIRTKIPYRTTRTRNGEEFSIDLPEKSKTKCY